MIFKIAFPAVPSVAPYAGAWIEIVLSPDVVRDMGRVAPYAGAWIEICQKDI